MKINGESISSLFVRLSNINDRSTEQFINSLYQIKAEISIEDFNLLIYGDKEAIINTDYKVISKMNNKWAIDSYLRYIVKNKTCLSQDNYSHIVTIYNYTN